MLLDVITGEADFIGNRYRTEFATRVSQVIKSELNGTVSVTGAGIYGVTAAVKLANQGYIVDLFEQMDDILSATSAINQYRVHVLKIYIYTSREFHLVCNQNDFLY
jgi:pyruvate/2-oxoglutarate dehydrogenase complex dihydrolipoamide dehydrogenase (E3) component